MPKKSKISQADLDTFQQAMAEAKPLGKQKTRVAPRPAAIPPKKYLVEPNHFHFHEANDLDPIGAEETMTYAQSGISHKVLNRLRKGQHSIEAMLDLHGMSTEAAENAIGDFLQDAIHHALRVVLIIHGKGHRQHTPILKNKLNHWLRETNIVLAFCSATAAHGGRGAIYVLLKRQTEENKD